MGIKYYEDPILGKGRALVTGGTGGGGGTEYVGGNRISIGGETISFVNSADIVNVTGTSVTIQPDAAYKIYATSQAITLNANPPAAGKWAYEGHLEIFTAGTGYIVTGTNVVLANALEPDAVNNCTVRFHDGLAIISVEDHVAGYIVVNGSTAGDGSLYYGIATSTNDYVAFDASLNGQTIPLAGAVAEGEKHIVGNGYTETTLTGNIDCGADKVTVANLGLNNVQVTGGTMTLGDAYIPSGSTVAVSGGGLAVEKVTGAGSESVIDLGYDSVTQTEGTRIDPTQGYFYGIKITNGNAGNIEVGKNQGGGLWLHNGNTIVSCNITGNKATYGGGIFALANTTNSISSSVVTNNTGTYGKDLAIQGGAVVTVVGSTIGDIALYNNAQISFSGSNSVDVIYPRSNGYLGSVTIASGATLDLTGNTNTTPIAPGGGITFASGGATVQFGATSGTVDSSYMMDNVTLPAGAKLTNTAVVDLGGTHITTLDTITGCTLTGGRTYSSGASPTGRGGAVLFGSSGTLTDCTISGNVAQQGGGVCVQLAGAVCTCSNCTITDNTPDDVRVTAGKLVLSGGTYGVCATAGAINVAGTTRIGSVTGTGSATLASGAILDLTGNTNTTPINPGGGITLCGGPMNSGTKIVGSAGSATQMREFEDVEIHGASISNQGIIYGATVTIPDSRIYHVKYTVNGGLSSGSITITGPTVYVLRDEISSMAGLTGVVNI